MIDEIAEFARLLRRAGLRVSSAEIIDAGRAVAALDLDASATREALAVTLVKRREDRATFDELFDLYFLRRGELGGDDDAGMSEILEALSLSPEALARALDALAARLAELSAMGRAAFGLRETDIETLIRDAGLAAEIAAIESQLQVGYYGYRVQSALGVDAGEREALEAVDAGRAAGEYGEIEHQALAGLVRRNSARLRKLARDHVQREFRRRNVDRRRRVGTEAVADRPLFALDAREQALVAGEIARLGRALRSRRTRSQRHRRGRFDLRRTMRRSLASGGVPFHIERRRRQPRRPRLVILCDVSDSVRNVARFMLQLAYTMQEHFGSVHSFAFVAELGELTDLFRRHEIERAIGAALGGEAVNLFANSNYGAVLEAFCERHLGLVTSRTTVVIIGDGRSNYHPSRADLVGTLARRARRVLWLCPEAPPLWAFGDSAMHEYQAHASEVAVVANLESLRVVARDLVAASSGRRDAARAQGR